MIKKILALSTVIIALVYFSSTQAINIKTPDFSQSFSVSYQQWDNLRVALYKVAIEKKLNYMDNSTPYPSGTHTLLIQMSRVDQLAITIVGTKDSGEVNLGIDCESTCESWDELKATLVNVLNFKL